MRKYWWIIIIGFLSIPMLLNFVLQVPNAFDVISDSDSGPGIWLAFWGAYLAAIGSFIMALVSYNQNKKQSQMHDIEIKIREAESRYNDLEKFVLDVENVHAWYNIENLKNAKRTSTYKKWFSEWSTSLNNISNRIIRYTAIFDDAIFRDYGNSVAEMNKLCLEVIEVFSSERFKVEDEQYKMIADEHTQLLQKIYKLDTGVLSAEMTKINELYNQLRIINE